MVPSIDRKRRRACVVGLDGVSFGMLERLARRSVIPRIATIIGEGHFRQMKAALPPVSSVSWTSFMTGTNPAEHGIFGFTDVGPGSYQLRFPLFTDIAVPTFWDQLGQHGLRCAVINQPATYPARQVPGILVSGFVAPDLGKSVWPKVHLSALQKMRYRVDLDAQGAQDAPERLLADLQDILELRRRACFYFWEQESWDYFQLVITGTDRLHHFLWSAVEQESDSRHDRVMSYYQAVDGLIGELWDRFHERQASAREGEGFFLLSDHGFTAARQEVQVNAWLREQGYLGYATDDPESVADIAPATRAFGLDPGRIYINARDRYRKGCVEPGEVEALRGEIIAKLSELRCEDEPVVAHVFIREDIYRGPRIHLAPDLVVIGRAGFDLKGTTKKDNVFSAARFQGMHTWDDAFVWSKLSLPASPEISDLAQIVLAWLLGEAGV